MGWVEFLLDRKTLKKKHTKEREGKKKKNCTCRNVHIEIKTAQCVFNLFFNLFVLNYYL